MTLASRFALLVLSALALSSSPARATTAQALSLQEMVSRADLVALVEVLDQVPREDARGRIVTDVRLRVLDPMRGDAASGDEVVLVRLGGAIGDLGMRVAGEPGFEDGARYVIFARAFEGLFRPVGMSQGVMRVSTDEAGRDIVQPGGGGLSLVRRAQDGRLVPGLPALRRTRPLESVLREVRALVTE